MLKTIKKSFLAVVLAVATLFALTSCVITGGGQTTTDPTLDAQAALSEFTEQVTFANTAEVTTSFNLPAAGKKGNYQIPITWTSNNEAVIAVTDLVEGGTTSATHKKANVTRPDVGSEDVTVTLTAEFSLTYTKNDGTSATLKETKTYNFTVLAKTADADAPEDVATLEVGVPYKLGMYQEAKEKTLYALNAMSGFYGASTETLEDADDVYVEEATNGYYIYFLNGTTKTYISCAYELGSDGANHFNYKLTDTASTVWAYDATAQKLTTVIEETELVLGTKSSYYTFSADEENIYFAHFYESPTASMTEDEKKVAADERALTVVEETTTNIDLPTTGANGSTITWESNNAAIAADGTVTRGTEDVIVTLTATIISGEASSVVTFEVKVIGTATPTYDVVTEYAENVAYKYGVVQGNVSDKLLFLTGEYANTYYGGTTTNVEEAADVYLVSVEGGYNLKLVKVDGTVLYINVAASGTHINIKFETAATSVWVYNSEYNTFTTNIDGTDYYVGTYSTHETMSPSKLSYAATSFVGHLYGVVTGGETPEQPEQPEEPVQPTDAEKLAEAKEALVLDVTEATENITLPAAGLNDVVITWASNNEAIATDGTVTRGATDVEVTLTATLTLGEATDTKEFTVVVKAAEQSEEPETPEQPTFTVTIAEFAEEFLADWNAIASSPAAKASFRADTSATIKEVFVNAAFLEKYSWLFTYLKDELTEEYPEATSEYIADALRDLPLLADGDTAVILVSANTRTLIRLVLEGLMNESLPDTSNYTGSFDAYVVDYSIAENQNAFLTVYQANVEVEPEEPEEPTDAEKLAEAKEALVLGVTEATENITLPATGLNDVVITWASNNEAIATDGTVTRGATDVEVTLTATLTLGEATDTKEFTVVVKAAEQPEEPATPTVLATFELGANGAAGHYDGKEISSGASYTDGAYTLTLTDVSKVWGDARDEQGNSCLKFGTSSVTGSMTFTVPENVTSVTIYVAKYKAKTTKVDINGTTYTVSTSSNDGEYTAYTVDTTTVKTITFTTVSGGVRAMINTIVFTGLEA